MYTLDTGDRHVVRAATRAVLAGLMSATGHAVPPDSIEFDLGARGKPYLRNDATLFFSISHSHDISMVAVTRVADVGVDVERSRAVPQAAEILRRFFSHEDIAAILSDDQRDLRFTEAWTRAESRVKVRGASVWEAATPDANATVRAITAPDGFAAAVAVGVPADTASGGDDWHVTQLHVSVGNLLGDR